MDMKFDLYIVVLVKDNGEKKLVYKYNGDPACYTSVRKAQKFASKMNEQYGAVAQYTVIQKYFELDC